MHEVIIGNDIISATEIIESVGEKEAMAFAVGIMLRAIGEDPYREGLLETPERVAKFYQEIFSGVKQDPSEHLKKCFEDDHHKELVIVKDIPFYSCCEHHLAPFHGKAHVGYIPNGKVVGLSKIARMVEGYAKRPQIQERLTSLIANAMMDVLGAEGCAVIIEAEHLCMSMRGVKKPGTKTVTSAMRGSFMDRQELRQEFMSLVRGN